MAKTKVKGKINMIKKHGDGSFASKTSGMWIDMSMFLLTSC
jgi:hypothetical protein